MGASLAAGRQGVKTIIIGKFGYLGELQTQGNNPIFSFVGPELHVEILQEMLTKPEGGGALKT